MNKQECRDCFWQGVRFTQEWVTQVTSDHGDDIVAAGKDLPSLPSEEEIVVIVQKAAQVKQLKKFT